ncbi:MAG TPA: glycosyltransferase [Candidatus Saccharimonadales bacterium]|nr:glycosyltransferase [Candidatus Saccharimonadales bacterium]
MSTKRMLFVDAQVFQTDAWERGIGKYSYNFLKSLVEQDVFFYDRICLIFNTKKELSSKRRESLESLYDFEMLFLDLLVPENLEVNDNRSFEITNQQILEQAVANRCDTKMSADFLQLALFTYEAYPAFPDTTNNILLWYDLIPYLFIERYGKSPLFESYLNGYRQIFKANIILTISKQAADDLEVHLGISRDKLVPIHGAPIDRKKPIGKKFINDKKYILMPSGDELRKNNSMAVRGFQEYCKRNNNEKYELIITSHFTSETQKELFNIEGPGKVTFAGNVSEGQLAGLYEQAECVLFVSEYEGLGLPVLEAVQFNKPCVCSSIGIFLEISPAAFYFVDEHDPRSIAAGINDAVTGKQWSRKLAEYKTISNKYSWSATAKRALNALHYLTPATRNNKEKKTIAVLCPSPTGYSAIGKVVMQLHPYLTEHFKVDYFVEEATSGFVAQSIRGNYLAKIANVYSATEFTVQHYKKYHAVIYHFGNSEFHAETIKSAMYLPGVAIVHDTHLSGLFSWVLREKGYVSADRIIAEDYLNQINASQKTSYLTSLANSQRAIITHSKYAENALSDIVDSTPIVRANLPVAAANYNVVKNKDSVKIGLAGILAPVKNIALLEKMASSKDFANCEFYMFGFSLLSNEEVLRLSQYKNIKLKTDLSDFEFQSMLSQLDILINYRTEYHGETSLTVLEALRYGVLPIVRNVGWYSELPKDVAEKVDHEKELFAVLKRLIKDKDELRGNAKKRIRYIERTHSYDQYAAALSHTINQLFIDKKLRSLQNEKIVAAIKRNASKDQIAELIARPLAIRVHESFGGTNNGRIRVKQVKRTNQRRFFGERNKE